MLLIETQRQRDLELLHRLEELAEMEGLRRVPEVYKVSADTLAEIHSKAEEADVLKADGARILSADWDIGEDRSILTEKLEARDSEGLTIYSDDGETYWKIIDNGFFVREVDAICNVRFQRNSTTPADDEEIGLFGFAAKDSLNSEYTYHTYAGVRAYTRDVTYNSKDGELTFEALVNNVNTTHVTIGAGNVTLTANLTLSAKNLITDTTTGTQLATAANQKLGFFGTTPVVQLAKASYNNWAALSDLLDALAAIGLIDSA